MRPLDFQVNIMQTHNAAKFTRKQKVGQKHALQYAKYITQLNSLKESVQVNKTDHVESALPLIRQEKKLISQKIKKDFKKKLLKLSGSKKRISYSSNSSEDEKGNYIDIID